MDKVLTVVFVLVAASVCGCLAGPAVDNESAGTPEKEEGGEDTEPAVIRVHNTDGVAHTISVSVETPNETFVHPLRVPAGSTEVIDDVGFQPAGDTAEYNVTVRALAGPERSRLWRVGADHNLTVRYNGDVIEFGRRVSGVRES